MAQLAIAAAGALAGGMTLGTGVVALGMSGPSIGWTIGALLGSAFGSKQKAQGPRLNDLQVNGTEYGQPIPRTFGSPRISGQVIWASTRRELAKTQEVGKGGAEYTTYSYEVDLLVLLADNETAGISKIWLNNELVYSPSGYKKYVWKRITQYTGASDQLPDPVYEAAVGTENAPAYRGRTCLFIEALQLGESGIIPNLTFEIGNKSEFFVNEKATCIAVTLDVPQELRTVINTSWEDFRNDWPKRPFWILKVINPTYPESYTIAPNAYGLSFNDKPVGGAPINGVPIDNGFPDRAVDWYTVCQLYNLQPGASVVLLIESQTAFTVSASIDMLADKLAEREIDFRIIYNGDIYTSPIHPRDYIAPFNQDFILADPIIGGPEFDTLGDTIERLVLDAGYELSDLSFTDTDLRNKLVRGFAVSQVGPTRNVLDILQQAYMFDVVSSDKIYIKPRSLVSTASIDYSELATSNDSASDSEPLQLQLINELELPSSVAVTYLDYMSDTQSSTEYSYRVSETQNSISKVELPLTLMPTDAKKIADVMLQETIAAQIKTTISLPIKYSYLEPCDVVYVSNSDGSTQYRFRIISKKDNANSLELECVSDAPGSLLSEGQTSGEYVSQGAPIRTADTRWHNLDIPILRDVDDYPGYYVSAKSSTTSQFLWQGANILVSWDNLTYNKAAELLSQCVQGSTTTVLGSFGDKNILDELNTVTVNIGEQELSSSTRSQIIADASVNLALIGNEILQFTNAEFQGMGVYTLSGLLRGRRGTEQFIGSHLAGERFVLLQAATLRKVSSNLAEIGITRYTKGVTYGNEESDVTPLFFTDSGVALKPLSPVALRAANTSTGIDLTWIRRTRKGYRYVGALGISVPLGENFEQYVVKIYKAGTLVRTQKVDQPYFSYTTAMQTLDGFTTNQTIDIVVAQLSSSIGEGHSSSIATKANN